MKNKKVLFVLLLICVLGIVGASIAYFSSTDTFQNIFGTKSYKMEVVETFESPDDWTPGTTTPKTVVATNKGNVDAAVRISFTEEWKDASNNPLPATDENNHHAAIINFSSDLNKKWITSDEDGKTYYYYKAKIAKNESTSTLIDSVTFNPALEIDVDHNCVTDSETHKQTCTSETSGYAGGSYKLTIKVETIQYDQYKNGWNTNVDILEAIPTPYTIVSGDLDTVGSEVCIGEECFHVIGQEDENHVKLLANYNLNVGNRTVSGTLGIQNSRSIGMNVSNTPPYYSTIPFSSTAYWKDEINEYPAYVYTNAKENGVYIATIAQYVEEYVNYLTEYDVNVSGRIINRDEMIDLGCSFDEYSCTSAPEWLYGSSYWTGIAQYDEIFWIIYWDGTTSYDRVDDQYADQVSFGVRPIIILEK